MHDPIEAFHETTSETSFPRKWRPMCTPEPYGTRQKRARGEKEKYVWTRKTRLGEQNKKRQERSRDKARIEARASKKVGGVAHRGGVAINIHLAAPRCHSENVLERNLGK